MSNIMKRFAAENWIPYTDDMYILLMDEVGKVFAAWEDDTVWDIFTVYQLEKDGLWYGVDREEYRNRPPDYIAKIIWPEYVSWWENYIDVLKRRKKRIITRKEAIKIASDILIKAEVSRKEFVEEEASRGIQYDEKDDK